ncbi:MAG: phosphatase PAP2 family protein [Pyrinomonadaceae bacterium]
MQNESIETGGLPEGESPAPSAAGPKERRRRAAGRLFRAEVFYGLGLAAFAALAFLASFNAYFGWDLRTSLFLQSLPIPGMLEMMRFVSLFGNKLTPFALTIFTAVLLLVFKRRSEAAGLIFSAGGSSIVNSLLKLLIARPRPTSDLVSVFIDLKTQSFPSGHVTFYVCYFGFLFFAAYAVLPRGSVLRRAACGATAVPVVLIGLSRVYLGAHWPSDTLGAYLVSGLWLALSLDLYRRWKERSTFH